MHSIETLERLNADADADRKYKASVGARPPPEPAPYFPEEPALHEDAMGACCVIIGCVCMAAGYALGAFTAAALHIFP